MKWNLLDTGFNRGRFNMDFDVELVQRKLMDQAFLRFYRWKPYCISLGFNQLLESIDSERAKKDNARIIYFESVFSKHVSKLVVKTKLKKFLFISSAKN